MCDRALRGGRGCWDPTALHGRSRGWQGLSCSLRSGRGDSRPQAPTLCFRSNLGPVSLSHPGLCKIPTAYLFCSEAGVCCSLKLGWCPALCARLGPS